MRFHINEMKNFWCRVTFVRHLLQIVNIIPTLYNIILVFINFNLFIIFRMSNEFLKDLYMCVHERKYNSFREIYVRSVQILIWSIVRHV